MTKLSLGSSTVQRILDAELGVGTVEASGGMGWNVETVNPLRFRVEGELIKGYTRSHIDTSIRLSALGEVVGQYRKKVEALLPNEDHLRDLINDEDLLNVTAADLDQLWETPFFLDVADIATLFALGYQKDLSVVRSKWRQQEPVAFVVFAQLKHLMSDIEGLGEEDDNRFKQVVDTYQSTASQVFKDLSGDEDLRYENQAALPRIKAWKAFLENLPSPQVRRDVWETIKWLKAYLAEIIPPKFPRGGEEEDHTDTAYVYGWVFRHALDVFQSNGFDLAEAKTPFVPELQPL